MKRILLFLLLAVPVSAQNFYMSNFKDTANPVSENSNWTQGLTTGLKWGNVRSNGVTAVIGENVQGYAYGTTTTDSTCTRLGGGSPGCNDSTAILNTAWGNDQLVCAQIYVNNALNRTAIFPEVELRTRTSIAANSITGYEYNASLLTSGQYDQLVRWNGGLNNFDVLKGATSPPVVHNGDTMCASSVGTNHNYYINGTLLFTFPDATYTSGHPGIAFFNQNGVANDSNYGLTRWFASDSFVLAATCNQADVATAISSVANGGLVLIPAGTCTWTTGVTISGKSVNLYGMGSGRIIAESSTVQTIGTGTKTWTVAAGLPIDNGMPLTVFELNNRGNSFTGTVSSYSGTSLAMSVTSAAGSCTLITYPSTPETNCGRWVVLTNSNTTIINNSATVLFSVTEDSAKHTNIANFAVKQGTGAGDVIDINSGGGQAILVHDMYLQQGAGVIVHTNVSRGVVWNISTDSAPFSLAPIAFQFQPFDQTAWSNTSFFGSNDTTGTNNFYVENSDFHAYLNATDNDEGARTVFRDNVMNNAGFGTHGADTGPFGQRYFEYYNNLGLYNAYNNSTTFPMNWWMFVRGGTYVVTSNTLPSLTSTDFGTKPTINMTVMNLQRNAGPNPCWGQGTSGGARYFVGHQVGMGRVTGTGHDGLGNSTYSVAGFGYSTPQYVGDSEPAYIWGNSSQPLTNVSTSNYGNGNSDSCAVTNPGGGTPEVTANYVQLNRDYFNSATAKPSYTAYTYPHIFENTYTSAGSAPAPTIGISPSPIVFGNQIVGTTSSGLTVTVSNVGNADDTLGTPFFTITGTNSTDIARTGGTCTNGATLTQGGGNCTIILTFTPIAQGSRSAQLNIAGTATGLASIIGGGFIQIATPTFSPVAGTYPSAQSVTISTTTGGAIICYTTDGSTPTANGSGTCTHGTTYSGPVVVSTSQTLKAMGTESGFFFDSAVATAAYVITPNTKFVTILGGLTINGGVTLGPP